MEEPRDDGSIVRLVLEGNTRQFGVLVSRYERLMFSFLLPQVKCFQEVQDISQEAFIKAFKHLYSFDTNRRFSAWILKIARNILIDRFRKNSDNPVTPVESMEDVIGYRPAPADQEPARKVEMQEEFRRTFLNILHLSEELKVPLLLRVVQELSYEEIAEIIDVPVQTVKNRIFKARKALREKRDAEHAL
jgi:RNA polymerase sigma-70 factor (ECF subfamily)